MSSEQHKEWYEILPDDVMLHILYYLNADSLYNISKLDCRLQTLVRAKRLWRYIDGRSRAVPNRSRGLASFSVQNINNQTRTLLLAGRNRFKRLFRSIEWIFGEPNYSSITVLALENQRLPAFATMKALPTGLQELSLRNTYTNNYDLFFKFSHETMSNLRVLILDGCRWVSCCMLMSVCKYPKLQILSLVRCTKLHDFEIYVSMAAKHGFDALRVLDVRHTRFGDCMVSAMVLHKRELRSLYFASYTSVFYPDVMKQMREQERLQHWREQGRLECVGAELDYDERKESHTKLLLGKKHELRYIGQIYQDVTDEVAIYFARLRHDGGNGEYSNESDVEHHSLLYKDPYSELKCPCIELDQMPDYEPPKEEIFPDRPMCVISEDSWCKENGLQLMHDKNRKSKEWDKNHYKRRLFELSNSWFYLRGYFSTRDVGVFEFPWIEMPGDEYEACCIAYNAAADKHYNLKSGNVTKFVDTFQINLDKLVDESTEQPKRQTLKRGDIKGNKRKRDDTSDSSSSSDNSSSSDDDDRPHRTITTKPKAKKRRKSSVASKRSHSPPQQAIIEVTPRLDGQAPNDDDNLERVVQLRLRNFEPDNEGPVQLFRVQNGIEMIPVYQFNKTISSKLKHLSLRGFKNVTNATLESLEHLSELRMLDVTGTRVTRNGIHRFLLANPNCHVIHQSCCRCLPLLHL